MFVVRRRRGERESLVEIDRRVVFSKILLQKNLSTLII